MRTIKATKHTTKKSSGASNKVVAFDATNEFKQTFDYWDYLLKKISNDRPLLQCEIKFVENFASEVKQIFKNRKEVGHA